MTSRHHYTWPFFSTTGARRKFKFREWRVAPFIIMIVTSNTATTRGDLFLFCSAPHVSEIDRLNKNRCAKFKSGANQWHWHWEWRQITRFSDNFNFCLSSGRNLWHRHHTWLLFWLFLSREWNCPIWTKLTTRNSNFAPINCTDTCQVTFFFCVKI